MAALAAGRQDKFWEFHDELFKNYNRINDQKIKEISEGLGLDQIKFVEHQKNTNLPSCRHLVVQAVSFTLGIL